ncbi:MAG: hypothetical protein I3273_01970 [Candidatus Moeniiplasma glomeromycotorum]|nr:hypothetical protein [Candidatus Moeniiplasma glomeromycotorum]MCE8167114.1 hypothetical protein [Candidatus Moeniiplasma glomeromycotorum]MCE8168874.1 hypothetical protein [Candidatus Moeniiplasma glomeromycotorum]
MDTIKELQDKIIKKIDDFLELAKVKSFELTDACQNAAKEKPELKERADKISRYWRTIWDMNDEDQIYKFYDEVCDIILIVQKNKGEREIEKLKKEAEWWKKLNAGEHEWQKKTLTPEEKQKRSQDLDKTSKPKDDFDEKCKQEYISDIEFELKAKKVSEAKLNERLGVGDWRTEINKTTSWSQGLDRRSNINMIIWKLSNDFVCAKCGEAANSSFPWTKGSKKYCSYECRYKRDGYDGVDASDIGKIVQAFQAWMKKHQIEKISYSANGELVIQFSGQTAKVVEESKLTSEQKEVKRFFKSNPQAREIAANQEYRDNSFTPKKSKGGILSKMSAGEITVVGLVIVAVVALVITLIVKVSRKQSQ